MKLVTFIPRKSIRRIGALVLIFITIQSALAPSLVYALTTGPHQPEYIAYEEPGATDMVNLATGDFSFSIPILDVPGPEGAFHVPLTYNAGIGPEQEASWAGLGWTLNVGAITRDINQFPDDASGEVQSVTVKDLTGIRGWTSSILGFGQIGWNNIVGHYGTISILGIANVNYDHSGISGGGLLGLSVNSGKWGFSGVQFAMGVMSLLSDGAASYLEMTVESAIKAEVTQAIFTDLINLAPHASSIPNAGTDGYWTYSKQVKQKFLHKDYWIWLDQTRDEQMYGISYLDKAPTIGLVPNAPIYVPNLNDSYLYYYDYEKVSISVNGGAPNATASYYNNSNTGSASDINYYIPPNSTYSASNSAAILATDNFSVRAPGISGNIFPYRLDVGSVSMPRSMTEKHLRMIPVPYATYKTPFIYRGSNASGYLYHTGNNNLTRNFGLAAFFSKESSPSGGYTNHYDDVAFNINDPVFNTPARADIVANNYKIPQGNHIEWMTNADIISATGSFANGFVDYFSPTGATPRAQFRQTYPFGGTNVYHSYSVVNAFLSTGDLALGSTEASKFSVGQTVSVAATEFATIGDMQIQANPVHSYTAQNCTVVSKTASSVVVSVPSALTTAAPGNFLYFTTTLSVSQKSPSAIGGFSITNPNGTTSHFSLPSYDYQRVTYIEQVSDANKNSTIRRDAPFANTWMITAITGPDYVDRNANGIIDEADWGYWVKFNYGKYQDNFQWRLPFGTAMSVDADNTSRTYTSGTKQQYYLNSIETRSHVALFLKDSRADGKDNALARSSLRLAEITLLTRDDYKKLFGAPYSQVNDSGVITAMWTYSNYYNTAGAPISASGNFFASNALKRVRLTHTYDLCHNTPNSTDVNKGKLTLKRVSVLGRNTSNVTMPDYKFDYNTANPNYNPDTWDGWEFYSSNGTSLYSSHNTNQPMADGDGQSWSMSRITTPTGSTIDVSYERDAYCSVSGHDVVGRDYVFSSTAYTLPNNGNTFMTIGGYDNSLAAGDFIRFGSASLSYTCPGSPSTQVSSPLYGDFKIQSISANVLTLTQAYGTDYSCMGRGPISINYSGTIRKIHNATKGGNLRVASITLNDQTKAIKTRYLYQNADGTCSGVVAQEPSYCKTWNRDFNRIPGYPVTPIMYSTVSVLSGVGSTDADFVTKEIYEFETPNLSQVTMNADSVLADGSYVANTYNTHLVSVKREIMDNTSKIGAVKTISSYDVNNVLAANTTMVYTSTILNPGGVNNYQGYFSEGTLMLDDIIFGYGYNGANPPVAVDFYPLYKMTRSSIIHSPYVLQKVIKTMDGMTNETDNIAWDPYSAQVVEKSEIGANGLTRKGFVTPAYTVYGGMGPKAFGAGNSNAVGMVAAAYAYATNGTNLNGLITGSVQTYKNDWGNYRYLSGGNYVQGNGETGPNPVIWRKSKTYAYVGKYSDLRSDGTMTFSPSNKFDFSTNATNVGWQETGENSFFDHYSMPLETFNPPAGKYSSNKMDFVQKHIVCAASNARYTEMAFSGAEDLDVPSNFFGGEVSAGSGSVISTSSHTGVSSLSLSSGYGFIFKPTASRPDMHYRVSVWTSTQDGRIYYKTASGAVGNSLAPTDKAGNWYQLNYDFIQSPSDPIVEIGVRTAAGPVNFDDFRVQPFESTMTARVYDPATGQITHVIGNDNTYTRFEYNSSGILVRTFSESFRYGGERMITEKAYDYKRFHTGQ